MDITGKVIAVCPQNSGVSARTGNTWMSQEYVLETHDQYPKKVCFRLFGEDRIKQFNIQMGEELTVSLDIDAHEYNGRWYNTLSAWNVTRVTGAQQAPTQTYGTAAPTPGAAVSSAAASPNDMPFPPASSGMQMGSTDDLPF